MIAPQGLEIGEKLLWLFEKPHDVTKTTRSFFVVVKDPRPDIKNVKPSLGMESILVNGTYQQ